VKNCLSQALRCLPGRHPGHSQPRSRPSWSKLKAPVRRMPAQRWLVADVSANPPSRRFVACAICCARPFIACRLTAWAPTLPPPRGRQQGVRREESGAEVAVRRARRQVLRVGAVARRDHQRRGLRRNRVGRRRREGLHNAWWPRGPDVVAAPWRDHVGVDALDGALTRHIVIGTRLAVSQRQVRTQAGRHYRTTDQRRSQSTHSNTLNAARSRVITRQPTLFRK
jgi:hypothetical protein